MVHSVYYHGTCVSNTVSQYYCKVTHICEIDELRHEHTIQSHEFQGDGVLRHVRSYVLLHNIATLNIGWQTTIILALKVEYFKLDSIQ